MSRSLFRSISVVCLVTAMLFVSGCSSMMLSQKVWAGALEPMTGITSIDLKYSNNWPTSSKQFVAEIVISPDLSEAQARAVAAESCRHSTNVTDIRLDTSAAAFTQQRIVAYEFADNACIDA